MGSGGTGLRRAIAARVQSPSSWDPLLLAVAGLLAISVGHVNLVIPGLRVINPGIICTAIAALLLVGDSQPARRLDTLRSPTSRWLLALLVWVVLSVPGGLYPRASFTLLTDHFVKLVVLYVLVVTAVRGPKDVERLAGVYFATCAIVAAVVLMNRVGHDETLYGFDANDLAGLFVTALPIGGYLIMQRTRPMPRIAYAFAILVMLAAFITTESRGGFVALAVVVGFALFRPGSIPTRWRVGAVVAMGLTLTVVAGPTFWTRMASILHPTEDYNYTSDEGRWQIWQRGIGYMLQHPVLGVGADNFGSAEGTASAHVELQAEGVGVKWSAAHNAYVQVGAELGIPGLIFFVCMLASAFRALRNIERAPPGGAPLVPRLALALTGSVVGCCASAVFLSWAYEAPPYTLMALSVGLAKVAGGEVAMVGRRSTPSGRLRGQPISSWNGTWPQAKGGSAGS